MNPAPSKTPTADAVQKLMGEEVRLLRQRHRVAAKREELLAQAVVHRLELESLDRAIAEARGKLDGIEAGRSYERELAALNAEAKAADGAFPPAVMDSGAISKAENVDKPAAKPNGRAN